MHFRLWSRVWFCFFIVTGLFAFGISNRANAASSPFTASISIVFDDGRVMFYKGSKAGISVGDIYALTESGETVAKIEIEQTDINFSTARVLSFTRTLREGAQYEFAPAATGEITPSTTDKKTRERANAGAAAEEKSAGEAKAPEVKELAKKSERRKKVEVAEEQTAGSDKTEAAGKDSSSSQAEKSSRSKSGEKTAPAKKDDKKTAGKKKEEKEVPKIKESKYADQEAAKFPSLPSTLGVAISGLSGMAIIPTTDLMANNHARLSWSYNSLSGSTNFLSNGSIPVSIDTKLKTNAFYFGYGLSDDTEIAISEGKNSGEMTFAGPGITSNVSMVPSKTTAFSIKYRFSDTSFNSKKAPKKESSPSSSQGVNVAILASMASDKDKEANRTKYMVYGLAAGVQVSDNAKLNLLYGSIKATQADYLSESDKMWGAGLEYMANEDYKLLAEFLKQSRYTRYKSLGVQYKYDQNVNFDLMYQIYSEDISDTDTIDVKGYQIGANYLF
ncbi:MAG: hypothetical protein WCX65_17310 [bacterium]